MDTKFFDDLGVTLSRTAKEFGEKAESFYGKQKTRAQIAGEERALEKALAALGKVIYQRYVDGEELDEEMTGLCMDVQNRYEKIASMKENMVDKDGKKICPSCKKTMNRDASFCPSCGAAYPEEVQEPVEEEAAVEEEIVEEVSETEAVAADEEQTEETEE